MPSARAWRLVLFVLATFVSPVHAQEVGSPGVVAEVRVHGNHTTPDADVLAIVGNVLGQPATETLLGEVKERLEKSGRFDGVEVRKRYRSIENADDILLVIVVDEVPGISDTDLTPGPLKRFRSSGMFLPILRYDDGYGFTYGVRTSFVDRLGKNSRLSVPLSWGGERQARLQAERTFTGGPVARLAGDVGIGRKENPHYEIADQRTGVHARMESVARRWLRFGGGGGLEDVAFGPANDRLTRIGADATIDTRVDPAFPRNAIHTTFAVERLGFDTGHANRKNTDIRGYLGLFGQVVLAVRGTLISSSAPIPPFEQSLLGGDSTLRGYEAGYKADDNVSTGSIEIRMPVSSPLSIGRLGVKAFVDAGTAFPSGTAVRKQHYESAYGGGVYLHFTILSVSLDVAHSEAGDTRAHFGLGVTFK
jgi:outer membrane protein assembly factor BamA